MPATGDKVAAGEYLCEHCEKIVKHADDRPLPYCPHCGIWTLFRRVEKDEEKQEQK